MKMIWSDRRLEGFSATDFVITNKLYDAVIELFPDDIKEMQKEDEDQYKKLSLKEYFAMNGYGDQSEILDTIFDKWSGDYALIEKIAKHIALPGEYVFIETPSVSDDNSDYFVSFFTLEPESRKDALEMAAIAYKYMNKYNITVEEVLSEVVQKEL